MLIFFFFIIGPKDSVQISTEVISRIKFASCQWPAPQQGLVLLFEEWQPLCRVHKRAGWHRQSLSHGSEFWTINNGKSKGNDFQYSHKSEEKVKYQSYQQRQWSGYVCHFTGQRRRPHPWIQHEKSPSPTNSFQRQMFCFQSGMLFQCIEHTAQLVLGTFMQETKTLAFCSM